MKTQTPLLWSCPLIWVLVSLQSGITGQAASSTPLPTMTSTTSGPASTTLNVNTPSATPTITPTTHGPSTSTQGSNTPSQGSNSTPYGAYTPSSGSSGTPAASQATTQGLNSTPAASPATSQGSNSTPYGIYTPSSGSNGTSTGSYTPTQGSNSTPAASPATSQGSNSTPYGIYTPSSGSNGTSPGSYTPTQGSNTPTQASNSTPYSTYTPTSGSYNTTNYHTPLSGTNGTTNNPYTPSPTVSIAASSAQTTTSGQNSTPGTTPDSATTFTTEPTHYPIGSSPVTSTAPITSYPATTSPAADTTSPSACASNPCKNGGTCHVYVSSSTTFVICTCASSFNGTFCETDAALNQLNSVNVNDSNSDSIINSTLTDVQNSAQVVHKDFSALGSLVETVNTSVNKLDEADTWTAAQKQSTGEKVVQTVGTLITSLTTCTSSACQSQQADSNIQSMEQMVFNMGNTLTKGNQDSTVKISDSNLMTVQFQKKDPRDLVKEPVETDGISVKLPDSLVTSPNTDSKLLLKIIVFKSSPYVHAVQPSFGDQAGPIIITRLENEKGQPQSVDASDPILLTTNVPSSLSSRSVTLEEDSLRCFVRHVGQFLAVQFSLPSGRTLTLTGRMDEEPTEDIFDFSFTFTATGVQVTYPHNDVLAIAGGSVAKMFVTGDLTAEKRVCVRVQYSGSTITSGRRRLLATASTSLQLSSSGVSVVAWDPASSSWQRNANVKLKGVDASGKIRFEANFFGTFSLTDLVVVPASIDFSRIFLNFDKYIRDSPFVLVVVCTILVIAVIVIIFLRRLDKADSALWAYLPLADNNDKDTSIYALSVHTSLSSPRRMTATPFFLLKGKRGVTDIRILWDGVRQNFAGGTVSNFILKCPNYLGPLTQLRIWHDNKGKNPHWKIDRVVVADQTTKEITVFVCRDWLSAEKSDGKISRHIPALTAEGADGTDVFDMVSKQRLFDDHLWLSVTRRPVYSTFTRVQRFVTAVALLFLSMVTNAMFYQGKEADQQSVRGVNIGPVQINYRQLFVGAVSAVIIVVPAVLIAFSFKRRKIKGVTYPSRRPVPQKCLPIQVASEHVETQQAEVISKQGITFTRENQSDDMEMVVMDRKSHRPNSLGVKYPLMTSSGTSSQETLTSVVEPDCSQRSSPCPTDAENPVHTTTHYVLEGETGKICAESSLCDDPSHPEACSSDSVQKRSDRIPDPMMEETDADGIKGHNIRGTNSLASSRTDSENSFSSPAGGHTINEGQQIPVGDEKLKPSPEFQNKTRKVPFLLPWWFIFVGYAIAGLAILAGAFFTFMYSLQWGGKTSLNWLLAFFFTVSTGNLLVEPLKIVLISIALSCLFRRIAEEDMSTVAPFDVNKYRASYLEQGHLVAIPAHVADPAEQEDTEELERRASELRLSRRMCGVLRELTAQALYVALLFVLCFHTDVHTRFLQNEAIRNQLALTTLKSVQSPAQTWTWLQTDLIPSLLPVTDYRGMSLTAEQRRFLTDQNNFRVGPITLTQYRVKGNCDLSDKVIKLIKSIRCVPSYDSDTEETGKFSADWVPCSTNCSNTAFVYEGGEDQAMAQNSRDVFYGAGGYRVILDQSRWRALDTLQQLQQDTWMDENTRAINIEINLFNANTQLFTQATVLLEYPSLGSCLPKISLRSAHLYPYITVWDYIVLFLQLVFILIVVIRMCMLLKNICFPSAGNSRCSDDVPVAVLELLSSICAIITYIIRIDRTILALERIRNEPEKFTSLDVVFFLDLVCKACLSTCLFIRILCLLGPLSFNRYLYVLRQTLLASRGQLYGLALGLTVVLTAFVSFFVLFEGPTTYRLRGFLEGYETLLTVLLTMTKYKALKTEGGDEFQRVLHKLMYGFYCLVAVFLVMNFAITVLNVYLSDVKKKTQIAGASAYNGDLGRFIWKKLQELFSACMGTQPRAPDSSTDNAPFTDIQRKAEDNNFQQLEVKLEEMLGMLSRRHDLVEPRLREVHGELTRTKNRLRQAELEAEHHRAQLSLWKEQVRRLSEGEFNTEVSFCDDKTIFRVLDVRGSLLYVLAWTDEHESPLLTCTATEMTQLYSANLDLETYSPICKAAQLSFSTNTDFVKVEVGFPTQPGLTEDSLALAVRYDHSSSWLYLPVVSARREFCADQRNMVWAELNGMPKYLAALQQTEPSPLAYSQAPLMLRKCPDCEFFTLLEQQFRAHRALHVSGIRFQCLYKGCGSQFLERFKLVKHLQEKHDYPLVCHWCGHAFTSALDLRVHVDLHFIKHYKCEDCEHRFYSRQQRDGHRFIAHGAWRSVWRLGQHYHH